MHVRMEGAVVLHHSRLLEGEVGLGSRRNVLYLKVGIRSRDRMVGLGGVVPDDLATRLDRDLGRRESVLSVGKGDDLYRDRRTVPVGCRAVSGLMRRRLTAV